MKFTPTKDYILAKNIKEAKTKSGLILIQNDNEKQKSIKAEVIASGKGKTTKSGKFIPNTIKPGDKILICAFNRREIELDYQKYSLIREEDVLAILS